MKKLLLTLAIAALSAASAHAGMYLNPHSKCEYKVTRYGALLTQYSGNDYTPIFILDDSMADHLVVFKASGNDTMYVTDFANITENWVEFMTIKYPNVTVQLTDNDGNSFAVMGACRKAARRAKVSSEEIELFTKECTSCDYDHLLHTCMWWFDVR
jgi:hypothetical protein